jgi:hypothetical protein
MGTFVHLHALRSTIPGYHNPTGAVGRVSTFAHPAHFSRPIYGRSMLLWQKQKTTTFSTRPGSPRCLTSTRPLSDAGLNPAGLSESV